MKINTVVASSGEWTIKVHTQPAVYRGKFFTCCSMTNHRGERIRLKTAYSKSEEEASEIHLVFCEKAKNFFGENN